MKKRTYLLFFILMLMLCLGLTSCGNEEASTGSTKEERPMTARPGEVITLSAPAELVVSNGVLSWNPVEGAVGYTVLCSGHRYSTGSPSLDIMGIVDEPNIEFSFTVTAKGDGKSTQDSQPSEPCTYSFFASSEGVDFIKYEGFDYYVAYTKDPTKLTGSVYIPGEYEGKEVREIMTAAFQGCMGITEVYLHKNIQRINEYSFAGCTALKSITLPQSLAEIGFCAFQDCISLTSVRLPEQLSNISGSAFLGCTSLSSLTVHQDNRFFRTEDNCLIRAVNNELTVYVGDGSGVLPSSVTFVGPYCFYRSPLKAVVLHEGITRIGDYAFSESAIQNPTLPSTLTNIGSNAFSYCEGITRLILTCTLDRIESRAYYSCPSLSLISFTGYVRYIDEEAFSMLDQAVIMLPASRILTMANNVFKGENMVIYTDYNTTQPYPWEANWNPWPMDWGIPESVSKDYRVTWKDHYTSYCTNCTFGMDENGALYVVRTQLDVDSGRGMDDSAFGGVGVLIDDLIQYEGDERYYNVCGLVFYKEYTPVPVREGYTFLGWALEEDGPVVVEAHEGGKTLTRQDVASCTAPETATTLYAVWEKNA